MISVLSRSLILTFAFFCSGLAAAEVVVPLTIGGTDIHFAADDGYLRTSEKLPSVHAVVAAGLTQRNRLVEAFVSEADAKRMVLGSGWQDTFLQVQVLRDAEALDFTLADWEQARPQIARTLGVIDLNSFTGGQAGADADARMSAAAGVDVSATFGELGKAMLYDSQGQSLRFVMLLPMSVQVAGQPHEVSLECAGAIVRLANKLVYLFAYRHHIQGNDTTQVRAALDRFVDRAIALNPAAPSVGIQPIASDGDNAVP